MKEKILSLLLFLGFIAAANETVGVIKVQNTEVLLKKSSLFLSKASPSSSRKFNLTTSQYIVSPELSPLNLKQPVTAYLYFSNNALQPVVFGTLLQGKRPKTIPFQPGQNLVPEIRSNRQVVFADPKFKLQVKNLQEDTIKLPQKLVAGQYFFRNHGKIGGRAGSGSDLAEFISTEFSKISFTAEFPAEDLLNIDMELEAKKTSGLFGVSNQNRPILSAPFILANPEYYCYLKFPANQTAADWIISFFSAVNPDFANDEQIYGSFLHAVATGDHATAIAISKEQDFYLLSGILPADKKEHFEKFLKTHGDSYNGKVYRFHCNSGSNVYVLITENRVNLLIRKQTINEQRVAQTFRSLKPAKMFSGKRSFLSAAIRKNDGTYEQILTSSMANGKFRFIANLPPIAVVHTIPDLLMGEDLFQE